MADTNRCAVVYKFLFLFFIFVESSFALLPVFA
jgi:hypothetical protein